MTNDALTFVTAMKHTFLYIETVLTRNAQITGKHKDKRVCKKIVTAAY
jgi:hypothetical protein